MDLGSTVASWWHVLCYSTLVLWNWYLVCVNLLTPSQLCSFCWIDSFTLLINTLYICLCRKQISTPVRVQGLERVKLVAVGAFHNLALLEDGSLLAWGNNEYGQLGTGDTQPRSQPIPVHGLSDLSLVSVSIAVSFIWFSYFSSFPQNTGLIHFITL